MYIFMKLGRMTGCTTVHLGLVRVLNQEGLVADHWWLQCISVVQVALETMLNKWPEDLLYFGFYCEMTVY